MSELHELRVGDHISLLSGFPFSSDYFDQEEGIRLIRIRDLVGSGDETFYRGAFDPRWLVKPRDILIGMDGDFNIVHWKGDEALLNQRILKANEKTNGLIEQSFFYYWCGPVLVQIHNRTAATTVKHLSIKDIEKAKGLFPTKSEQRRIAEILSTVDEAIEQTEALIAKYQQIKAGLMHDLFTRGVTPDGHLRPTSAQAPHLYNESPFGWIPKEWEVSKLRDKSSPVRPHIKTGPFGSSLKGEHWVENGRPVITIGALGEGELLTAGLLFVSEATAHRLREYQLQPGDVVFSRVADVGRSAVICEEHDGWIMSSNLMRISLNQNLIVPGYLQAQFAFDHRVKAQIRAKVNSGGRDVANGQILNQLQFAWPRHEEQHVALKRISALDANRRNVIDQQTKLLKLKQGLMHDLLTGRVRVDVAEPAST